MTVRELLHELRGFDPDTKVILVAGMNDWEDFTVESDQDGVEPLCVLDAEV